jgi:23S rRNA (cytidine1920-2'-O)/16S rRNA (cytidine1409-2'-O)-methyltransferase
MRIDQLIVQQGLAPSRSAAQRLIARGAVRWRTAQGWAVPRKAGEELPEGCAIEVTDDAELRYVSRGGLKLDGALARCGITVAGAACLDMGQGSGGFTDVLLQRGAARVVGIDVGHGQLHARLRTDARVECYEELNARDVTGSVFEARHAPHSFDLIVADVAFISLTLVLPTLARYLAQDGQALLLVKPQFELQPQDIGKGGIVKDASAYALVEQRIRLACMTHALSVRDYFASPIDGGDGNSEFFVRAQPAREAKP